MITAAASAASMQWAGPVRTHPREPGGVRSRRIRRRSAAVNAESGGGSLLAGATGLLQCGEEVRRRPVVAIQNHAQPSVSADHSRAEVVHDLLLRGVLAENGHAETAGERVDVVAAPGHEIPDGGVGSGAPRVIREYGGGGRGPARDDPR